MEDKTSREPTLPGGTVTFLFTDIKGSTRLLSQLGEDYVNLLVDHHRLLRAVFARHNDREVDTEGDAFFVSFPRAIGGSNLKDNGRTRSSASPE